MWDQSRKREKVYVAVNSDIDATGSMTPRAIRWADGRIFRIDQVDRGRALPEFQVFR